MSLLRVELLLVITLGSLCLADLVDLLLKSFIFNLGKCNLVVEIGLCANNCMLIVEVVRRNLVVHALALSKASLQLKNRVFKIL